MASRKRKAKTEHRAGNDITRRKRKKKEVEDEGECGPIAQLVFDEEETYALVEKTVREKPCILVSPNYYYSTSCSSEEEDGNRKPENCFFLFSNKLRGTIKRECPHLNNNAVSKFLGEMWGQLSESQKRPFKIHAAWLKENKKANSSTAFRRDLPASPLCRSPLPESPSSDSCCHTFTLSPEEGERQELAEEEEPEHDGEEEAQEGSLPSLLTDLLEEGANLDAYLFAHFEDGPTPDSEEQEEGIQRRSPSFCIEDFSLEELSRATFSTSSALPSTSLGGDGQPDLAKQLESLLQQVQTRLPFASPSSSPDGQPKDRIFVLPVLVAKGQAFCQPL